MHQKVHTLFCGDCVYNRFHLLKVFGASARFNEAFLNGFRQCIKIFVHFPAFKIFAHNFHLIKYYRRNSRIYSQNER